MSALQEDEEEARIESEVNRMGYMRHHAIIVTGWDYGRVEKARNKAANIFPPSTVSRIIPSPLNGYWSFFIAPDGSKGGWEESDQGDKDREQFIDWLNDEGRCDDGSSWFDWVEVQYGDDENITKICRHSDEERTK